MNHINNTHFPGPILEYFKAHEHDNKKELRLIFKKDKDIRKKFLAWSESHKSIVSEAPRLYSAEIIAKKINSKASASLTISTRFNNQDPSSIYDPFQMQVTKQFENFSKANAITALTLYHLKLINEDQFHTLFNEKRRYKKFTQNKLYEILSSDKYSPGIKPIFNEKIFSSFVPYLEKLVGRHLLMQLSLVDAIGRTPLFSHVILKSLIPLLKTRNVSLTLLSRQDKQGNNPFHFNNLLEEIMPVLNVWVWRYPNKSLIDALTKLNNKGSSPLHSDDIMETFNPILKYFLSKKDFYSIYTLLSCKDRYGKTPLHYGDIYEKIICILQNLSSELNRKLHATQDNEGNTPLHYEDIMEMAVKDLPISMFMYNAKELFIIQNRKGDTPLHRPNTLKNAYPVLTRLKPEDLDSIISITNDNSITVRQIIYNENMAFPLLNNILLSKLKNIESSENTLAVVGCDLKD